MGRRFDDAVYYSREQRDAHTEFSATFTAEQISRWSKMLEEWNKDPNKADPFQEPEGSESCDFLHVVLMTSSSSAVTAAEVRRDLAQEEERELALGVMPLHEVSLSQFLVNGMELEDAQWVLYLLIECEVQ